MSHLSIEIIYCDADLIEIMVSATNGRYSGVTCIYINGDGQELIDFGNQIKGFPKSISHIVENEFGFTEKDNTDFQERKKINPHQIKPISAHAGLKFYCIDQAGHSAVHIILEEAFLSERAEPVGKASFEMRFEPAQIDIFSNEVIELGKVKSGKATLAGIHNYKDNNFQN